MLDRSTLCFQDLADLKEHQRSYAVLVEEYWLNIFLKMISNHQICMMCNPSPSCLVTIGLRYLRQPFLQAQGLHSIWLTWKQMCFHRADWAFIAACGKLGFTASVWLKKKKRRGFSSPREAILCHHFTSPYRMYTLHRQSVQHKTCMLNEEMTTHQSYNNNNWQLPTFLLVNFQHTSPQI